MLIKVEMILLTLNIAEMKMTKNCIQFHQLSRFNLVNTNKICIQILSVCLKKKRMTKENTILCNKI